MLLAGHMQRGDAEQSSGRHRSREQRSREIGGIYCAALALYWRCCPGAGLLPEPAQGNALTVGQAPWRCRAGNGFGPPLSRTTGPGLR
jgi:hypothetical protein